MRITTFTLKVDDEYYNLAIAGLKLNMGTTSELLNYVIDIEMTSKDIDHIVILRASLIFSPLLVMKAIYDSLLSFKRGRNVARKFPVEVMLHLSGKRQISEAMPLFAPQDSDNRVVICVLSKKRSYAYKILCNIIKKYGATFDLKESIKYSFKEILKAYNISEEELVSSRVSNEDLYDILLKCVLTRIAMRKVLK